MKTFCVSQKRFTQVVGYGLWSLSLIGLIIISIASSIELQNVYDDPFDDYRDYCYDSVLNGETKCYDSYEHNLINRNQGSICILIIDIIVGGVWFYYKQSKFKFMWCENRASQSHESESKK